MGQDGWGYEEERESQNTYLFENTIMASNALYGN